MKIALTIPGFSAHGGINVILEWANRLSEFHDVTLITSKLGKHQWYPLEKAVKVTTDIYLKNGKVTKHSITSHTISTPYTK